ncbi:MAG: hypothetical protein WD055_05255 [Candidatus Dependentiae bacterium]
MNKKRQISMRMVWTILIWSPDILQNMHHKNPVYARENEILGQVSKA